MDPVASDFLKASVPDKNSGHALINAGRQEWEGTPKNTMHTDAFLKYAHILWK